MGDVTSILNNPVAIIGVIICLVLGLMAFVRARRMPYVPCDALLTKGEMRFYTALKNAVPDHSSIMMKVRMSDIINCDDRAWKSGWGPRISAKHIDFVLIDPVTTKIKLCIELDDSTHRTNSDRIERDRFVNKAFEVAGVRLLRIPVTTYYDNNKLRRDIDMALSC